MGDDGRDEHNDAKDQLDQLLQELRVAIPGVQMLFGFLLTVPFNERFHRLGTPQRALYFVVFIAAAFATIAFIGPSSFHRLHNGHDKRQMLRIGNKLAIAGLAFLTVSIVGSVYLLTEVVFGAVAARIATAVVAAAAIGAWFVLPLSVKRGRASSTSAFPPSQSVNDRGRSGDRSRRASSSRPSAAPS